MCSGALGEQRDAVAGDPGQDQRRRLRAAQTEPVPEGRGIDGSPAMIRRARAAAARLHDPAIGLVFEATDMIDALASEADFPADIVLWHGSRAGDDRPGVQASLAAAGDRVIGDGDAGTVTLAP